MHRMANFDSGTEELRRQTVILTKLVVVCEDWEDSRKNDERK